MQAPTQENSDEQGRAIPFILFKRPEGFVVTDEARQFFQQLSQEKLGIVSVVGKYRTGKSYLINKVILQSDTTSKKSGFAVGSTVNACTKGIWLWTKTLRAENEKDGKVRVVVMDTEGIGAVSEGSTHDSRVALFSLLLSSMFVYNSMGNIDEKALEGLGLVVSLAKKITKENSGAQELDDETIAEAFPFFLWVVRDFALQLVDQQNFQISSSTYLEKALELIKGGTTKVEAKNKVRRLINHFFRKRDCVTIVRPVEKEADLQKLDELPEWRIRTKFLEQVEKTRGIVLSQVRAKKVNGQYLDGPRLLALADAYVSHINNGHAPCIENAWEHVRKFENQKTTTKIVDLISRNVTLPTQMLSQSHHSAADHNFGFNIDLVNLFRERDELNLPRELRGKLEMLSRQMISSRDEYAVFKARLKLIYEGNILGGVSDNQDLIEDFTTQLDRKMEDTFLIVEKQVETAASSQLKSALEKACGSFLEQDDLQIADLESVLEIRLREIMSKYHKHLGKGNGVETRVRATFEREKARALARLLTEVQTRQEMEREAERRGDIARQFRAEEQRKQMEDEMESVRRQFAAEKDKSKENTKERVRAQVMLDQANQKISALEQKLTRLQAETEQRETHTEEQTRLHESERSETREQQTKMQREIRVLTQKCQMQKDKISETQNEVCREEEQRRQQEKRAIDAEQKLKATVEEFERERGNKVVMDNEQLRLLEDNLQGSIDRALTAENALKEKHTETELLKAQLDMMEQKFRAIEARNRQFLEEVKGQINNLENQNGAELSVNLSQALETFAIWKKVLRICNLFQCGKCAKFVPKKGIWAHLDRCLDPREKKLLGFQNDPESEECLLTLGIQPVDTSLSTQHPHALHDSPKPDHNATPTFTQTESLELKVVQSLIREQQVEGEARPYTEYIFRVRGIESGEEWHVARKFKEFCQLLVDLQERHSEIELPRECAELWDYISNIWGLIGNSQNNQDRRVELIDRMMSAMAGRRDLLGTGVFAHFLCLQGKHNQVV